MNDPQTAAEQAAQEAVELAAVNQKPFLKRLGYYARKSGPGWLQAAITLGGGSLAGAMYLGVFMGYNMMWLQPLAMIIGVVMLSAIAYVTLSTGDRPFHAIKSHVSPVLAWAWLVATLMANIVWCMPQFSLGTAAVQQNLLGMESGGMTSTVVICLALLVTGLVVNYFYLVGAKGVATFELILKIMVAVVVISFFGVVGVLTAKGALDWGAVFAGLVPDLSLLSEAAPTFLPFIEATGDYAGFWKERMAKDQLDIMMTAFGTAVGINMTFLLPYSMLRKSWGRHHRQLAIFDLTLGLILPFVLATGCVVIAAASQFHTKFDDVLAADGTVSASMAGDFHGILDDRLKAELGEDAFTALTPEQLDAARAGAPQADRELAAMLTKRNNFQLANALTPLAGETVSQKIFGIGVFGMALSTIIILMLINGFTFCEMFGKPDHWGVHMAGCAVAGIAGFLGPIYIWQNAGPKLAVPTSVIGGSLIPIAYFTFFLMMNSRKTLGDKMPKGARRLWWNVIMAVATTLATIGTVKVLLSKGTMGMAGIALLAALFLLGVIGFFLNEKRGHGQP